VLFTKLVKLFDILSQGNRIKNV